MINEMAVLEKELTYWSQIDGGSFCISPSRPGSAGWFGTNLSDGFRL